MKPAMQRVVVTGANGFIGRHTLSLLANAGFEVHALCRSGQSEPLERVRWHTLDLMDDNAVDALLNDLQATHLLHLAWYTEHGKFWHADENLNWIACSLHLLACFARHGGKRVVMAGSCAEYDWQYGHCTEEQTPCHANTLYGVCKHALHQVAAAFCLQHDVSLAWGRVFFLYGPNETASRFVPLVINGLLRQQSVPCSDGHQLRDFMHVADVGAAFAALLASDLTGAVNIASGEPFTLRAIGEKMMRNIGGDGRVDFGALPNRRDDPDVLTADVSRLYNELGWKPFFSLQSGLADSIAWWRSKNNII
ncbi:MAG: NAD(P)-dependent oxidoreductase [Mariprofundaceae bacterium]